MPNSRKEYVEYCKRANAQMINSVGQSNFRIFYPRDTAGNPVGVFVSVRYPDGFINNGFSAKHSTREKTFNKAIGLNIALRRALGLKSFGNLPDRLVDEFAEFQYRAEQRLAEKLCSSRGV